MTPLKLFNPNTLKVTVYENILTDKNHSQLIYLNHDKTIKHTVKC